MSANILTKLEKLKADSKKRLPEHIRQSLFAKLNPPLQLAKIKLVANAHWAVTAKDGAASLVHPQNRQASRKVITMPASVETNFTYTLNDALLGGQSYPILTTVLGTAAGVASFGAGLIFSASTTALSKTTSQRILARGGDEIWLVEEIGKFVDSNSKETAIHVCSFWLCDPYRGQTSTKGWLIHEERKEVLIN